MPRSPPFAPATTSTRPGPGIPELRTAIAEHQRHWYGLEHDPDDEVLVTAGATEAIAAALLALCEPGDEVVTFEPYYDSYAACIAMAGADSSGGAAARARLVVRPRRARAPRSRPAPAWSCSTRRTTRPGKVFSRDELDAVAAVCVEHDLIAVTDEVYEHLVFDGEHVPLATLPGMRERTLTISSAGKTFSCTGWKIGWVCGPAELVSAVRTAKQFLTYVNGGPFQYAIAIGLGLPDAVFAALADDLREKRDRLRAGLADAGPDRAAVGGLLLPHRRRAVDRRARRVRVLPVVARTLRCRGRAECGVLRRRRRRPPARALRVLQAPRRDRRSGRPLEGPGDVTAR